MSSLGLRFRRRLIAKPHVAMGGRLGRVSPDGQCDRHDGRPKKQPQEPECLKAAKDAEENPEKRQSRRHADEHGAYEMIGDKHDQRGKY